MAERSKKKPLQAFLRHVPQWLLEDDASAVYAARFRPQLAAIGAYRRALKRFDKSPATIRHTAGHPGGTHIADLRNKATAAQNVLSAWFIDSVDSDPYVVEVFAEWYKRVKPQEPRSNRSGVRRTTGRPRRNFVVDDPFILTPKQMPKFFWRQVVWRATEHKLPKAAITDTYIDGVVRLISATDLVSDLRRTQHQRRLARVLPMVYAGTFDEDNPDAALVQPYDEGLADQIATLAADVLRYTAEMIKDDWQSPVARAAGRLTRELSRVTLVYLGFDPKLEDRAHLALAAYFNDAMLATIDYTTPFTSRMFEWSEGTKRLWSLPDEIQAAYTERIYLLGNDVVDKTVVKSCVYETDELRTKLWRSIADLQHEMTPRLPYY